MNTHRLALTGLTAVAVIAIFGAPAQAADSVAPRVRSNAEHPAVVVARLAAQARVDSNHFLVQPPASVTWTVQPEAPQWASVSPLVPR